MEPDTAERAMMFWAKVMLLALVVDLILLAVDHKLKNDVIKESRALREEVARVRGGASPAAETDRGGGGPRDHRVDAVDDGPPASPPALADEGLGQPATVDGLGSPPHRGGVNAG